MHLGLGFAVAQVPPRIGPNRGVNFDLVSAPRANRNASRACFNFKIDWARYGQSAIEVAFNRCAGWNSGHNHQQPHSQHSRERTWADLHFSFPPFSKAQHSN
jgi:hypothetical protein